MTGTRFATFSRTTRRDVEVAVEAGGTANHEVQMVATGSRIHLEHKRGISREAAVLEVTDTVAFARSLGVEHISVGIEDASRGDDDLLRTLTESAVEAGATCIILADTTGCHTPDEYGTLIGKIRAWAPAPIRVSTHCHNDFGLSLANALAGLHAGADEVQVTLGGVGERAGNTPLEELAALLAYKTDHLGMYTDIELPAMYSAYNALRAVIKLDEPRNKPIFGKYAFGTAAGIHQQGMLSNPETYEFVEPARFGRQRSMLIARHSGRAVLRHLLGQLGVEADAELLNELYRVHIAERVGSDCEDLDVVRDRLAAELVGRELVPDGLALSR
jgi:2-isopropylmalate synthase